VFGALFTGRCGHSFLTSTGVSDEVGFLTVSPTHIRIGSCFLHRYEFPKDSIEKLILREHQIFRIARLRIIHKLADAPQYVLFVACDLKELKASLTACGFEISEVENAQRGDRHKRDSRNQI
jgi:hypothetical protein